MTVIFKKLSYEKIMSSGYIQSWLEQFTDSEKGNAIDLLVQLKFISRDDYSQWLQNKLSGYNQRDCYAIYSVRKFSKSAKTYWTTSGAVQSRPATTQGSEDLVSSIISSVIRSSGEKFLDHPSLNVLRDKRVREIILIDDSIGSGKRVGDFIRLMTNHATFKSWWSFGFIKIHILSLVQTMQSRHFILENIIGSDHGIRKCRVSGKIAFDCDIVYDALDLKKRWGLKHNEILSLCDKIKKIDAERRKGFGNVMGNYVFYHSVPNNIPGMLVSSRNGWIPLFPNRVLPEKIIYLLENNVPINLEKEKKYQLNISEQIRGLLENIKKGIRTEVALSRSMNVDVKVVSQIISCCIGLGFLSSSMKISDMAYDYLMHDSSDNDFKIIPKYLIYIPSSWRVDQGSIQPFDLKDQTDSADLILADGDDGESSLEITDAIATSSPVYALSHEPSMSRKREDIHGSFGLKEE